MASTANEQTDTTVTAPIRTPRAEEKLQEQLEAFAIRRKLELLDERELATFLGVDLRTGKQNKRGKT